MEIHRVAVVGVGVMGTGIAASFALGGFPVLLKDVDPQHTRQGYQQVQALLLSRVKRKVITGEAAEQALERLTPVDHLDWFDQMDLIVEAVPEELGLKLEVFKSLDEAAGEQTILATNTSSLSITRLASVTRRSDRVLGMHFFNPAHVMKLVEVVDGLDTRDEVAAQVVAVCRKLGKQTVRVEECPSFLVNRLLGRYLNEALYVLQDGIASVEELDRLACELAMPMGPLALRDLTGLDVGQQVARYNHQEYGPRYEPAPLLAAMVGRGWLGQKSGLGFYAYEPGGRDIRGVNPGLPGLLSDYPHRQEPFDVWRLFLPMINEAFLAIQERVVRASELDLALRAGLGMRQGPLQLAEELGLAECLRRMEALQAVYGERFRPAPLLKRLVWGKRSMVLA